MDKDSKLKFIEAIMQETYKCKYCNKISKRWKIDYDHPDGCWIQSKMTKGGDLLCKVCWDLSDGPPVNIKEDKT